jgi:ribosomal protein L31E
VTDAKNWEGVREGVQDYEYFVMLRQRVAELDAKGATGPAVDAARKLLTDGPVEVTSAINEKILEWSKPKDRGIMDRVRVQVLQALTQLRGL